MSTLDLILLAWLGICVLWIAFWCLYRRPGTAVLVCELGNDPKPGWLPSAESGAAGLRFRWFSDGHARRRIRDRRWVRATNVMDDQVNLYFEIPDRLRFKVAAARRIVIGVEYFDLAKRPADSAGFWLQYETHDDTETFSRLERYDRSGGWCTAYFDGSNMLLKRALPKGSGGADFRVHLDERTPCDNLNDLYVRRVFLLMLGLEEPDEPDEPGALTTQPQLGS